MALCMRKYRAWLGQAKSESENFSMHKDQGILALHTKFYSIFQQKKNLLASEEKDNVLKIPE